MNDQLGTPSGIALKRQGTLAAPPLVVSGVSCLFTTRLGGVSRPPYSSANLGGHVGDDAGSVRENRLRALSAMGAGHLLDSLIVPHQVHSDVIVSIGEDRSDTALSELMMGCDSVICHAPDTPVLLCFADCVPVILIAPQGSFAVVHSGWKGTILRIASKTASRLAHESMCSTSSLRAYIGPHVSSDEYEVSLQMAERFRKEFHDDRVVEGERSLSLEHAVRSALLDIGIGHSYIESTGICTFQNSDEFFSHRRDGVTGRQGALAVRKSS